MLTNKGNKQTRPDKKLFSRWDAEKIYRDLPKYMAAILAHVESDLAAPCL